MLEKVTPPSAQIAEWLCGEEPYLWHPHFHLIPSLTNCTSEVNFLLRYVLKLGIFGLICYCLFPQQQISSSPQHLTSFKMTLIPFLHTFPMIWQVSWEKAPSPRVGKEGGWIPQTRTFMKISTWLGGLVSWSIVPYTRKVAEWISSHGTCLGYVFDLPLGTYGRQVIDVSLPTTFSKNQ